MEVTDTIVSGNRKVIVPQGLLDADINNVIRVPKELAHVKSPMVVALTRKGLVARILPDFNDQLAETNQPEGSYQHFSVMPCSSSKPSSKQGGSKMRGSSKPSNLQKDTNPSSFNKPYVADDSAHDSICSGGDISSESPKLLHSSMRFTQKLPNAPKESRSITINVPDGIDLHALQHFRKQSASGWNISQISTGYHPQLLPSKTGCTSQFHTTAVSPSATASSCAIYQCPAPCNLTNSSVAQLEDSNACTLYKCPAPCSEQNITDSSIVQQSDADACDLYQCSGPCSHQNTSSPSTYQTTDDSCSLYQCPAPCSHQNTSNPSTYQTTDDSCSLYQCPAPCSLQNTSNPSTYQTTDDACSLYQCSAPCSPQNTTSPSSYHTTDEDSYAQYQNARSPSIYQTTDEDSCALYHCAGPCGHQNTKSPSIYHPSDEESCAYQYSSPCSDQNVSSNLDTPDTFAESPYCSFQSYLDQMQLPDQYPVQKEWPKFKGKQPSRGAGLQINWRHQQLGGFQPRFISTPNRWFDSYHEEDHFEETGYNCSEFGQSDVNQNIWETPPSLGLPKAAWCFEKTELIDPFEEARKRKLRQRQQNEQGECQCY